MGKSKKNNPTENLKESLDSIQRDSFRGDRESRGSILILNQKQDIRFKILMNRYYLGIILNILTLGTIIFTTVDYDWYSADNIEYGLIYYRNLETEKFHMNTFGEDLKEYSGVITFILYMFGVLIQSLIIFQQFAFVFDKAKLKFVKNKTLRYFSLLFYTATTGLVGAVMFFGFLIPELHQLSRVGRDIFICPSAILVYYLICIYFSQLKKQFNYFQEEQFLLNSIDIETNSGKL